MTDPKFQWSVFAGPNRSEQFVVRSDDFEDFQKNRDLIQTLLASSQGEQPVVPPTLPQTAAKIVNETNPYESIDDESHVCNVHHKQMKERVNRKTNGIFYDHRMKDDATGEWQMCNGDGQWRSSSF